MSAARSSKRARDTSKSGSATCQPSLHHSRDLGEPFDFVTYFEYAPEDAAAFEDLVARLRETEEWRFVTREVDIRLER